MMMRACIVHLSAMLVSGICLFALLGCGGMKSTKPKYIRPQSARIYDAKQRLLHSNVWIGSRVYGFAGEQTNQAALALDVLLDSENSKDVFQELLDTACPAGQLYALCGLYHVSPVLFKNGIERFRANTNIIEEMSADTIIGMRICDIVFSPYGDRKGETNIVLRKGQTVAEWIREHGKEIRPFMDISGGSIPMLIIGDKR